MSDPQSVLLSYFSGELTFHGTLFLGIVGLVYTFTQLRLHDRLRSEKTRGGVVVLYGLVLMGLVAGLVFTAGKLLYYGQFVYYTIKITPGTSDSLFTYYNIVEQAANSSVPYGWFVKWFGSIISIGGLFAILCGGLMVRALRVRVIRTTIGFLAFGLAGFLVLTLIYPLLPGTEGQTVLTGIAYAVYSVILVMSWRPRGPVQTSNAASNSLLA